MRLRKLIPYDSLAVLVKRDEYLLPEFVTGEHARSLSTLRVPVGSGLCGWVGANRQPVLNGNPSLDLGFAAGVPAHTLRAALAVPLEEDTGLVGVMVLYCELPNAFSGEHLRILQVVTARVSNFIENALRYRQAEAMATVDHLHWARQRARPFASS